MTGCLFERILKNYLEKSGYKVYEEAWLKNNRNNRIDIVAKKEGIIIGYEIKRSFIDVERSLEEVRRYNINFEQLIGIKQVSNTPINVKERESQLKRYIESGRLDYLYLVIPCEIYERVVGSYGHILETMGVGIVCIARNGDVEERLIARKLNRISRPNLKEHNEGWLAGILCEYFEKHGYRVEKEARLIVPESKWFNLTYGRKHRQPNSFLLKIDLCLLPLGRNVTYVLENQDSYNDCLSGHVGIEVKVDLRKEKDREETEEQLKRYAESKCLTRLYLATADDNIRYAEMLNGVGKIFGIINYIKDRKEIKVEVPSPKLEMKYDGFIYMSQKGHLAWEVGSSTPTRDKTKRFARAVVYGTPSICPYYGKCKIIENVSLKDLI